MEDGADNSSELTSSRGTYDDGTGGNGGGTVTTNKSSWSGSNGYIDGKLEVMSTLDSFKSTITNFDSFYYNTITKNEDDKDIIKCNACGGGWNSDNTLKGAIYNPDTREILKYFGQNSKGRGAVGGTFYDHPGGGAGYYGGECSNNYNGGAAGGSAYADLTGTIKQVIDVTGYSGYENGNGAEMKGRYGNGKVIISR